MKTHLGKILVLALAALALHLPTGRPARAASWITNTPMAVTRYAHTATVLTNGTVLIAGGNPNGSAELYNPTTGTVMPTGTMNVARYGHTAVLLANGTVLVAGGSDFSYQSPTSTEIYNPVTGLWTVTGSLTDARVGHTMTLLKNGTVLVVGGVRYVGGALRSAEVYDPASGVWQVTNSLSFSRYGHTATRLSDGKVLVAGGLCGSLPPPYAEVPAAELFDPVTGTWSMAGILNVPRSGHQVVLLPDGGVLVAAGADYTCTRPIADAEVYDPVRGTWTAVGSLNAARVDYEAVLLPNGKVLAVGGVCTNGSALAVAEIFEPGSGTWASAGALNTARSGHRATLLGNGNVLVAGGFDTNNLQLASTETYTSSNVTASAFPLAGPTAMPDGTFQFTFTNKPDIGFVAYATTNLSQPMSNWTAVRKLVEVAPGQYRFADPQATNGSQRFYRVFAP